MFRQPEGSQLRRALIEQYEYDAIQTCAGDSTCATVCPVDIDTGALMKQFRAASHGPRAESVGLQLAKHWSGAERMARFAVVAGSKAGDIVMGKLTTVMRAVISEEVMPAWTGTLPRAAASKLPRTTQQSATAVYCQVPGLMEGIKPRR